MIVKRMLRILLVFATVIFALCADSLTVYSLESDGDSDTREIMDSLAQQSGADELMFHIPNSAKEFLKKINMTDFSSEGISELSFDSVMLAVGYSIKSNMYEPLRVLSCVLGVILINAVFDSLKYSESSSNNIISLVSALCILSLIASPMLSLVGELSATIENSANFMTLYIPVISILVVISGKQLSGGAFYASMIYISNVISQLSARIIVPMLHAILSLSIVTSVSDKVSLEGIVSLFKKLVKWILCFCMSMFVAFITMKTVVTAAEDSISNRAIKFAINSFVPLVGGALSDAYQTVISCVGVLKSGVGVAAVVVVFAIFLPAVVKCVLWQAIITVSGSVCDVFQINRLSSLLSSFGKILSSICAILLSIMVIYIVSTAVIIIVGG
ncbi:MAG: stage III sporulation protein AE [Lachnospiraceae bacterium]|nr:stage III sporulation protein AE [Lachnospiraceae bacterium]